MQNNPNQLTIKETFERGYSIIPVNPFDKRSLSAWKEYQERKASAEEITEWTKKFPNAAYAFVTGKASGLIVLDFDQPNGPKTMHDLGLDPHIQTPSGGYHVYVDYPGFGIQTLNHKSKQELNQSFQGLDIKGDGGYVLFKNGVKPYTLLRSPVPYKWDDLPENLRSYLTESASKDKSDRTDIEQEQITKRLDHQPFLDRAKDMVSRGEGRNNTGFWLACQLRDNGFSREDAISVMSQYVQSCPSTNAKGEDEQYGYDEARASLDQAYSKSARDPWEVRVSEPQSDTAPEGESDRIKFPEHVISGVAGEFADLYTKSIEAPRHFLYMSFLTCLGNMISGYVTLESELKTQARLYTVIMGESAEGRKSTAITCATKFFLETFGENSFGVCYGIGSPEGLPKLVDGIRKKGTVPHVNLLLYLDEVKQLAQKMKVEGSVLLPCINTLFEDERYENATKNSHINLKNIQMSMLGATTVDTYQEMCDSAMADIGLINRLWIVPGNSERRFPIPEPINQNAKTRIGSELAGLITAATRKKKLAITREAMDAYSEWYFNIEKSIHARRLDSYAMRLMCILAVNEGKDEVDADIIRKVVDLCNWQLEVRKVYDPIDADSKLAKLEELIRRALARFGSLTLGKLKKTVNGNRFGIWVFNTALENLRGAGEIIKQGNAFVLAS